MPYAGTNKIAQEFFTGAIEITEEKYQELLGYQLKGKHFVLEGDAFKIYETEKKTIYSKEDGIPSEIYVWEEIPETHTDIPRPSEYHKWETDTWVEDTATMEKAKHRELLRQLDAIDAEYHSDRSWREFVIANPEQFSSAAVARMQLAENRAEELRIQRAELLGTPIEEEEPEVGEPLTEEPIISEENAEEVVGETTEEESNSGE